MGEDQKGLVSEAFWSPVQVYCIPKCYTLGYHVLRPSKHQGSSASGKHTHCLPFKPKEAEVGHQSTLEVQSRDMRARGDGVKRALSARAFSQQKQYSDRRQDSEQHSQMIRIAHGPLSCEAMVTCGCVDAALSELHQHSAQTSVCMWLCVPEVPRSEHLGGVARLPSMGLTLSVAHLHDMRWFLHSWQRIWCSFFEIWLIWQMNIIFLF